MAMRSIISGIQQTRKLAYSQNPELFGDEARQTGELVSNETLKAIQNVTTIHVLQRELGDILYHDINQRLDTDLDGVMRDMAETARSLRAPEAVEFYDGNPGVATVIIPASTYSGIKNFSGRPRIAFIDYVNYRDAEKSEARLTPVSVIIEPNNLLNLSAMGFTIAEETRQIYYTDCIIALSALRILMKKGLVLGRPLDVSAERVKKGNDIKSRLNRNPLAPIHTLRVDPEHLAVWKTSQAEREHASGYTHDSPYIVAGFMRSNGTVVADYARGGKIEERIELNELLKGKAEAADPEMAGLFQEEIDRLLVKFGSPQAHRSKGSPITRVIAEKMRLEP